jgi:hypothetical protein
MKTLTIILTTCFLSTSSYSNAQIITDHENTQFVKPSGATKGYYSIANNAQKLNRSSSGGVQIAKDAFYPVIQKGYYSIGNNREKLGKRLLIQGNRQRSMTPGKGYFSIGRNPEKHK